MFNKFKGGKTGKFFFPITKTSLAHRHSVNIPLIFDFNNFMASSS